MKRCRWAQGDEKLMQYHDCEYGKKKGNDDELFEKLCLECFQAGLSWRTVLYKREALRKRFYGFKPERIILIGDEEIREMMNDESLIRNRRKIEAVIENAGLQAALFPDEGSFSSYVYSFGSGAALSQDLKRKGYRFAGPVICESFLMSVGAIEGHEPQCFLYGRGRD